MSKAKLIRLIALSSGAVIALGGCSSGWLPWVIGAGLVTVLTQQQ